MPLTRPAHRPDTRSTRRPGTHPPQHRAARPPLRRALIPAALVAALLVPALAALTPSAPSASAATNPALTPAQAVSAGAARAAASGVTQFVTVVDRSTGKVLAETANAHRQVASESIIKLFITAHILRAHGGYAHTPADLLARLTYMIRYSDDATATALFSPQDIPSIAAAYGLTEIHNATDHVGHWGAARITAYDMALFLYRAERDPMVGPWLMPVMAHTQPKGSDGFNQHFGLNALSGEHGSKQAWGGDSYFTAQQWAIHSVGYTSDYDVAILQLASSYPDPSRGAATYTAELIQQSRPGPPADGTFVRRSGDSHLYRIAGGAPILVSDRSALGGSDVIVTLTSGAWSELAELPADGTWISAGPGGTTYRIEHGAPVADHAPSGTVVIAVDPAAIAHAGGQGVWSHLRVVPGSAPCTPFPDVNRYNQHCGNIAWLGRKDITKPADGLYHPTGAVTRGQMAAFLFRMTNPGAAQPDCHTQPFRDVPTDQRFCGYISWAGDHHIAFGYADGTYRPDAAVTRGAMAAYLYRIAGPGHPAAGCTARPFDDVAVSGLFCGVITWARDHGVTYGVGDGSDYGTTQQVTRQAMASFLRRVA